MTEAEIRNLLASLHGTRIVIGSAAVGTPESHCGDTFCFYDPDATADQKLPFATIATHDTPGWDEVSDLDRPGAFRVNLAVGRKHQPDVGEPIDYSVADTVLPHPQYAAQGWVAVVNPGASTAERVRELIGVAYGRAVDRHWGRPSGGTSPSRVDDASRQHR
jgi:hypothetical protein